MEGGVVKPQPLDPDVEALFKTKLRVTPKALKRIQAARPKTYHEGANDERTSILAKVRRERKRLGPGREDAWRDQCLAALEKWLLQRNERYKKNPGGL